MQNMFLIFLWNFSCYKFLGFCLFKINLKLQVITKIKEGWSYTSLFSTEEQIARALNEQFMHYNGHLVSSEIDLVTTDDVCPKPRWDEKTKTCDPVLVDESTDNW